MRIKRMMVWSVLCGALLMGGVAQAKDTPSFKKVMIVIFENFDYSDMIAQPFFGSLAKGGADLSQFYAEVHPSQANYVALTSGSLHGVPGDGNIDLDVRHVGDLLEEHGKTWKVYVESWPGNCYTGSRSGTYVRKHNPFISYVNVHGNTDRCNAHIVDASVLAGDIANGTLPDYSFYVPDLNNDGHDTDSQYADNWFSGAFGPLLHDSRFTKDMLLVATTDESSFAGGQHIYTVFWGDSVVPGSSSQTKYNHYSVLRTIEDTLGIGSLGLSDATATPVTGIWK
jgi:hypothetical protein